MKATQQEKEQVKYMVKIERPGAKVSFSGREVYITENGKRKFYDFVFDLVHRLHCSNDEIFNGFFHQSN